MAKKKSIDWTSHVIDILKYFIPLIIMGAIGLYVTSERMQVQTTDNQKFYAEKFNSIEKNQDIKLNALEKNQDTKLTSIQNTQDSMKAWMITINGKIDSHLADGGKKK